MTSLALWHLVRSVQIVAFDAAVNGTITAEVDQRARIAMGPYAQYFTHRLGHGTLLKLVLANTRAHLTCIVIQALGSRDTSLRISEEAQTMSSSQDTLSQMNPGSTSKAGFVTLLTLVFITIFHSCIC